MSQYLLDASAVIDWLKGRRHATELLADLMAAREVIAINAITTSETFSGVPGHKVEETHRLLSRFEYWPIDYSVARRAGEYRYRYARLGRPLSVADTLMAAHAVTHDATLVTGNVRDFPMEELSLLRVDH